MSGQESFESRMQSSGRISCAYNRQWDSSEFQIFLVKSSFLNQFSRQFLSKSHSRVTQLFRTKFQRPDRRGKLPASRSMQGARPPRSERPWIRFLVCTFFHGRTNLVARSHVSTWSPDLEDRTVTNILSRSIARRSVSKKVRQISVHFSHSPLALLS